jgi:hypothetical protein
LAEGGYRIGAVSKITGIGTETLRAWERRYTAVTPGRTSSGGRIYSRDDVAKLLLLKSIVDAGHAISSVASLGVDELKIRWNSVCKEQDRAAGFGDIGSRAEYGRTRVDQKCRVGLIGDGFPLRVTDGLEDFEGIELIGVTDTLQQWIESYVTSEPHVIIIESPTINAQTRSFVNGVLQSTRAWHVIILYGFANQELMSNLQDSRVTAIRHSVDIYGLARLCIDRAGGDARNLRTNANATLSMEQSIPARRYSNKSLAQLASISPTIKCECPQHVTQIIKSLVAFEIYCAECENNNKDDASLHAYLHGTTAQVRSIMEDALAHIIKSENIPVPGSSIYTRIVASCPFCGFERKSP